MATDFSELGLDPDLVRIDLEALGIDDSVYTDEELESLSLAANLILLQAISLKSTDVEEELAAYSIDIDISSGMQETLNDLRDYVSSDGNVSDVVEFLLSEQTYIEIDDASSVAIDHTASAQVGSSTITSDTYTTLQDYLDDLYDDDDILDGGYSSGDYSLFDYEFQQAIDDGTIEPDFIDTDGNEIVDYGQALDAFLSGDAYLYAESETWDGKSTVAFITADEFRQYLVAKVLQEAGYISDEALIEPINFVDPDQPDIAFGGDDYQVMTIQLVFGKLALEIDADAGTVSVDFNGSAGLWEMGIDLREYFQNDGNGNSQLYVIADEYADDFDSNYEDPGGYPYWDDIKGDDLTKSDEWITNSDIDTLLQTAATAIESQSNETEVALLTVNNAITEWGELNDVWDLVHEYIHDALKRAGDNAV